MSKTKFNGFEKYFITTALKHAIEEAEENIKELVREGKRPIYAEGYFEMVGKDLIAKVHNMTLKRDQGPQVKFKKLFEWGALNITGI